MCSDHTTEAENRAKGKQESGPVEISHPGLGHFYYDGNIGVYIRPKMGGAGWLLGVSVQLLQKGGCAVLVISWAAFKMIVDGTVSAVGLYYPTLWRTSHLKATSG